MNLLTQKCRLLNNYFASNNTCSESSVDADDELLHMPRHFFREILLSYRVIFGQHKRSRSSFKSLYGRALRKEPKCKNSGPADPLLLRICSDPWDKLDLYRHIKAPPAKNHYSTKEFPYFGERLLRLQQFTDEQDPSYFWQLLHDRRNICKQLIASPLSSHSTDVLVLQYVTGHFGR